MGRASLDPQKDAAAATKTAPPLRSSQTVHFVDKNLPVNPENGGSASCPRLSQGVR